MIKPQVSNRLTKLEYGCLMALSAAARSEGRKSKVGCAIEDHDGRIIATGYNGYAPGFNLDDSIKNNKEARPYYIHAECNALSLIKKGEGKILYCTHAPCDGCAQNIAAHQIDTVVYIKIIPGMSNLDILNRYKIKVLQLSETGRENIKSCLFQNLAINI